jgi:hypothetical protein
VSMIGALHLLWCHATGSIAHFCEPMWPLRPLQRPAPDLFERGLAGRIWCRSTLNIAAEFRSQVPLTDVTRCRCARRVSTSPSISRSPVR